MKKILYIISIISCATHSVYAQKDSITWGKSLSLESRPYAPLSGNTLSKNIGASFSMFAEYKHSSLLILKGVDLVDEKSSANYLFIEYAYKKAYEHAKLRYSLLKSVNNPALVFDSKGSMSGASIGLSCGKYPRFELSSFYIVPWYYDPNYIIKPKLIWEKSNKESFSVCGWYNSGMFGKKTGLSAGVEYDSKKIVLKNGMHAKISIVYNYDIAGNILHIENQSSRDVFSIRSFLNF